MVRSIFPWLVFEPWCDQNFGTSEAYPNITLTPNNEQAHNFIVFHENKRSSEKSQHKKILAYWVYDKPREILYVKSNLNDVCIISKKKIISF